MYERGMFGPAMKLASTGREIAEASTSETRLLLADLWTTIGAAQLESSVLNESYVSVKLALDLRLAASKDGLLEPTHPQIANSYMRLGTTSVGIGRAQEAIELGEKSIELRLSRKEDQIQMLAMSHHNVALAALNCGQLDKADNYITKAIEITSVTSESMTPEQAQYVTTNLLASIHIGSLRMPAELWMLETFTAKETFSGREE